MILKNRVKMEEEMKRKLMFLACMLFAAGAVACTNVSTVENNPVEPVIVNEPDTSNPDTQDVNIDSNSNVDSNDDSNDSDVAEDPILKKYKEYAGVSNDRYVLFDMGFENPVFICIEGDYWLFGMDKKGNVKEIDNLLRGAHSAYYWLREGEPVILSYMTIGSGEATSSKCLKINEDFSVTEEYEIIQFFENGDGEVEFDENNNYHHKTEFYINGELQDIAPEEYEGYIPLQNGFEPIDDSFIDIDELFNSSTEANQGEQYIKVYNYDRFATNNEEDFKKSMRNVINDASEEQEFIKRFIGENADTTVFENSVYKMVTSESGDKESIVFFVKGEESVYPELAFGLQFDKSEAANEAMLTDETDKEIFDRITALDGSEYALTDLLRPLTDYQEINYVRDANNKLVKAEYQADPKKYGTYNSTGTLYYDENERPVMKSYYVTSGSADMIYVYDDNGELEMICEFGGMPYGPLEEYPGAEIGFKFSIYLLP